MLNAYIDKNDVLDLLKDIKTIDGLIGRDEIINKICSLKQHKKPKPKKQRGIYNSKIIIKLIEKYQNDVQTGIKESYLIDFIKEKKIFTDKDFINGLNNLFGNQEPYFYYSNIIPLSALKEIIRCSKKTIYNIMSKDLKRYNILIGNNVGQARIYGIFDVSELFGIKNIYLVHSTNRYLLKHKNNTNRIYI